MKTSQVRVFAAAVTGVQPDEAAVKLLPQSFKDMARLKVLDMIDYFNGGLSLAVAHGNPLNITNDDMCGKNIAVIKGLNAQLNPNVQEALTQLASKRVDGVSYDTVSLVWAPSPKPSSTRETPC
ncbi:hypothetical protein ACW0JT_00930 [Arthrobacter sp. SA17]